MQLFEMVVVSDVALSGAPTYLHLCACMDMYVCVVCIVCIHICVQLLIFSLPGLITRSIGLACFLYPVYGGGWAS